MATQSTIMTTQASFARAQKRISDRQFIAAHRPSLVIREIEVPEVTIFSSAAGPIGTVDARLAAAAAYDEFSQLTGSFRLTNNGESNATVRFIEATLFIGPRLPPQNPSIGLTLNVGQPQFPPGGTTRIDLLPRPTTVDELLSVYSTRNTVYVVGKVVYDDERKHGRRTGFARRLNLATLRFEVIESDPDYEYTD
jgi:hypothetical protein